MEVDTICLMNHPCQRLPGPEDRCSMLEICLIDNMTSKLYPAEFSMRRLDTELGVLNQKMQPTRNQVLKSEQSIRRTMFEIRLSGYMSQYLHDVHAVIPWILFDPVAMCTVYTGQNVLLPSNETLRSND